MSYCSNFQWLYFSLNSVFSSSAILLYTSFSDSVRLFHFSPNFFIISVTDIPGFSVFISSLFNVVKIMYEDLFFGGGAFFLGLIIWLTFFLTLSLLFWHWLHFDISGLRIHHTSFFTGSRFPHSSASNLFVSVKPRSIQLKSIEYLVVLFSTLIFGLGKIVDSLMELLLNPSLLISLLVDQHSHLMLLFLWHILLYLPLLFLHMAFISVIVYFLFIFS